MDYIKFKIVSILLILFGILANAQDAEILINGSFYDDSTHSNLSEMGLAQKFWIDLDESVAGALKSEVFIAVSPGYQIVSGHFKQITRSEQFQVNNRGEFIKYRAGTIKGFQENKTIFIRPGDRLLIKYDGDKIITRLKSKTNHDFENEWLKINDRVSDSLSLNHFYDLVSVEAEVEARGKLLNLQMSDLEKFTAGHKLSEDFISQAKRMLITETAFKVLCYFSENSYLTDYSLFAENIPIRQFVSYIFKDFLKLPPPEDINSKYNKALLYYCKYASLKQGDVSYSFSSIFEFIVNTMQGLHKDAALTALMLENIKNPDFDYQYLTKYYEHCTHSVYKNILENALLNPLDP